MVQDTADRQEPDIAEARTTRLKEKIETLKAQMVNLKEIQVQLEKGPATQVSLTDPDARAMATSTSRGLVGYNVQTAVDTQHHLIVAHEVTNTGSDRSQLAKMAKHAKAVLDSMQKRLDKNPDAMRLRRQTVEHPFGTLKDWMGATHFLTRTLERVSTEMSLHVLAYNLKRVMKIIGIPALTAAMTP